MYVGRIVAVGRNPEGRAAVLYRVSSRSFPNRMARVADNHAVIVPLPGHEGDMERNPYIAYRCLRVVNGPGGACVAVATNGSHTDPIAEKVAVGVPIRDALAAVLLALDYEKDEYHTPRIAAVVEAGAESGFLGVIRDDGLEVREMPIPPGRVFYLATYEISTIDPARGDAFPATTAAEGARYALNGGAFAGLTMPVTAVCALAAEGGFELAACAAP